MCNNMFDKHKIVIGKIDDLKKTCDTILYL